VTRSGWWSVLGLGSIGVFGLDLATGPFLLFPIMFVVPVGLWAWYLGRGAGIGFAITLVGGRLAIVLNVETEIMPPWAAIRLVILVGLAVMMARLAQRKRRLEERVQVLEGILPICAFCKKIRSPDGAWEQIEAYVSQRSAARFSHGFCEPCGREHYPGPNTLSFIHNRNLFQYWLVKRRIASSTDCLRTARYLCHVL